jgi:hypothetical protein
MEGSTSFETAGDGLYDPTTDTIYRPAKPRPGRDDDAAKTKRGHAKVAAPGRLPAGDDMVVKVRMLLQEGRMVVTGREIHNGTAAWAISLKPNLGRPVWKLWVSAADGKPLELRDPGRDASEQPQVIRWPTYEVLRDADADRLLTLTGAHPSAHVVRDAARSTAAEQRLARP